MLFDQRAVHCVIVYYMTTVCGTTENVVLFPGHFLLKSDGWEWDTGLGSFLHILSCPLCTCTQECESLAKENAVITGHQNLRQKIQFHAATKLENNKLKEVGTPLCQ